MKPELDKYDKLELKMLIDDIKDSERLGLDAGEIAEQMFTYDNTCTPKKKALLIMAFEKCGYTVK